MHQPSLLILLMQLQHSQNGMYVKFHIDRDEYLSQSGFLMVARLFAQQNHSWTELQLRNRKSKLGFVLRSTQVKVGDAQTCSRNK